MSAEDSKMIREEDGKNKGKVYCSFCPSKMLNAGTARLRKMKVDLPHIHCKGEEEADQRESIYQWWLVEDMYTFENIGVCHTTGYFKYLACADCERGPVGFQDRYSNKSYIALSRVKHE